jgi:23S rRNA (adenine2503-C2)-methyltransferase
MGTDFRDLTLDEVEQVVASRGERSYRARQILHWVHARGAESFDEMRDLPAALRNFLKQSFTIGHPVSSFVSRSSDGTRKLLIALDDGEEIEAVIIPTEKRVTLCMSSQVGCALACEFCATARMGLRRNLTPLDASWPQARNLRTLFSWGWASRWQITRAWCARSR